MPRTNATKQKAADSMKRMPLILSLCVTRYEQSDLLRCQKLFTWSDCTSRTCICASTAVYT